MPTDAVDALVGWIRESTAQHGTPLLRTAAERRLLRDAMKPAIGAIIHQAASPSLCSLQLQKCFAVPSGLCPSRSGPLGAVLRATIADKVLSAVRADPGEWCRQDAGADGIWPSEQVADAAIGALRQITMDSVVSYLQARGFLALTFGYYSVKYRRALALNGTARPRQSGLASLYKGTWEVGENIAKVSRHLPAVIGISAWHALTKTTFQALRTTPGMLAVIIFLFLTSDAWKIFGSEPVWRVTLLLAVLTAISLIFFIVGTGRQRRGLFRELIPPTGHQAILAEITPAAFWVHDQVEPDTRPLGRFQALNVNTVYFLLMGGNFLAVCFCTAAALAAFGMLALPAALQASLAGSRHVDVIFSIPVRSRLFVMTPWLLVVALVLGGIAMLSFGVSLQDDTVRERSIGANITDLQSCVSAFHYYQASVESI